MSSSAYVFRLLVIVFSWKPIHRSLYRGPIRRNDRRGRELRAKMLACSKEDDARRAGIQSSTRKRVVRVGVGDGGEGVGSSNPQWTHSVTDGLIMWT